MIILQLSRFYPVNGEKGIEMRIHANTEEINK